MTGRYKIIRDYFGLFDDKSTVCVTDSLQETVNLCEALNRVYEDRPFDFDFEKVATDVDEVLDFIAGESLFDAGYVLDCKNIKEYSRELAKHKCAERKELRNEERNGNGFGRSNID